MFTYNQYNFVFVAWQRVLYQMGAIVFKIRINVFIGKGHQKLSAVSFKHLGDINNNRLF